MVVISSLVNSDNMAKQFENKSYRIIMLCDLRPGGVTVAQKVVVLLRLLRLSGNNPGQVILCHRAV